MRKKNQNEIYDGVLIMDMIDLSFTPPSTTVFLVHMLGFVMIEEIGFYYAHRSDRSYIHLLDEHFSEMLNFNYIHVFF